MFEDYKNTIFKVKKYDLKITRKISLYNYMMDIMED